MNSLNFWLLNSQSHSHQESTGMEWSDRPTARGDIAMTEDQGTPPFPFSFSSDEEEEEDEEEPMTYDEISMQQSRHFLHSLQELKNLRPQLYSAAEYYEISYLNSDHKQIILENLKDYALKAMINTVDHLGSVSYKLSDLLNQQDNEISSTELRIACLNQRFHKCQEYTDGEGLLQQCLVERIPRFHKHYVLPGSVFEDLETSPENWTDIGQNDEQTTLRPKPSEFGAAINAHPDTSFREEFQFMPPAPESESFFFLDTEVPIPSVSSPYSRVQSTTASPCLAASKSFAAGRRDSSRFSKSASMRLPSDDHQLDMCKPPARSKSLISYLLNKRKSVKQRISRVS
jgi:hypothetical protein